MNRHFNEITEYVGIIKGITCAKIPDIVQYVHKNKNSTRLAESDHRRTDEVKTPPAALELRGMIGTGLW